MFLGLVVTVTLPVFSPTSGAFIGVVGVDISVTDLMADAAFFKKGQNSYAFVIDKYGNTLTHPLIPRPNSVSSDSIQVNIQVLETDGPATMVIDSMKR